MGRMKNEGRNFAYEKTETRFTKLHGGMNIYLEGQGRSCTFGMGIGLHIQAFIGGWIGILDHQVGWN